MPVHPATTLDVPFSTPTACAREVLTPSPLTLRNSNDHEELIHGEQGRTHLPNPSGNTSLLGTSRPSVIVYKVATGPNLAGSRDVIRVSYGEGHRKRKHPTSSGHRNKERNLSRQGHPPKEYASAKRDMTKHPDRKVLRSKLCSVRGCRDGNSGLRRADTKVSGKLPPAERVEGDMAWDFGAGPEKCQRRVDADRTRVRVGGLTSVRMIPRTVVDGEVGPKTTS
jgi:hypothetical protein